MTESSEKLADPAQQVMKYVTGKVSYLQQQYLQPGNRSRVASTLAQLRRSANRGPGMTPETWSFEFEDMPKDLIGKGLNPSAAEWAAHIALTLYAVHQRSQNKPMHVAGPDYDFGCAVRKLVCFGGDDLDLNGGQMPHRFAAMVTAQSVGELAHYARQIIGQLHAKEIPIDYGRFARQVYLFQFEWGRSRVCLDWARAYTRRPASAKAASDEQTNN